MEKKMLRNILKTCLLITMLLLTACGGDGAEPSGAVSPISNTGDSSTASALTDIIGYKIVQTVQRSESTGTGSISQPGDTVEYTYLSSTQVLGAGLTTLPTSSWSYTYSGSTATIQLNYGSIGDSREELQFTSAYEGTYKSITTLYSSGSVTTVWGTFILSNTSSGGTTVTHNGITYGTVTSPYTGKVWLDRNVGAVRACQYLSDNSCYGDYYQWGRNKDGHESQTSLTTTTLATSIDNVGSKFITKGSGTNDWVTSLVDEDGSLRSFNWSKTDASSVCPVGYKIPSTAEFRAETLDISIPIANGTDAFNNFLKIPSAGYRNSSNGSIKSQGATGTIWTNSPTASLSDFLNYTSEYAKIATTDIRTFGFSIRCIKN